MANPLSVTQLAPTASRIRDVLTAGGNKVDAVFAAVRARGLTTDEIVRASGGEISRSTASARLAEMFRDGVVDVVGERKNTRGYTVEVYKATV